MVDQNPYLTEPKKEIKEPESRSTPKAARYASQGMGAAKEGEVTDPMKVMLEKEQLPPPSEGKMGGRLKGRDKLPRFGHLQDTVNIYNQRKNDWGMGWEHRFNKRDYHIFFKRFNASETGPYKSEAFYCAPYRNAIVFLQFWDTLNDPTSILVTAWFSWDGVSWFWYKRDFWGHMDWEDTAMPLWEAVDIPILAPYMQIRIGVTGGSSDHYFPVEISAVFNST